MSWEVKHAEAANPNERYKPQHHQEPSQLQFHHTGQRHHYIYIVQSQEGRFFGVAYVGEVNPDKAVSSTERKVFNTWPDARAWLMGMQNSYPQGLNPEDRDVFDGRVFQ